MYLFTGHTPCQPLPISNLNTAAIFIQWSVSMSALASYFCSTGIDQWATAGDDEVLIFFLYTFQQFYFIPGLILSPGLIIPTNHAYGVVLFRGEWSLVFLFVTGSLTAHTWFLQNEPHSFIKWTLWSKATFRSGDIQKFYFKTRSLFEPKH